jgi:hypothetical protein
VLVPLLSSAAAALALGAFAMAGERVAKWLHVCAGLAVAALVAVDLAAWIRAAAALAIAHLLVAALPSWRGRSRSRREAIRDALLGPGAAAIPVLAMAAGALATGGLDSLAGLLSVASQPAPVSWAFSEALTVATAVLALDGHRPRRATERVATEFARPLGYGLASAAIFLAASRARWIASMATLPVETTWSEPPALVNALKLDAHLPLYGPPERLDSYTYSALPDLLHHAVLAPLGLQLSLLAHRSLVVVEQLVAFAILLWAMGPRLARAGWGRVWSVAALLGLAFVNQLAAAVHPDHLVLIAFAVAIALLAAEPRWKRPLWWAALVAVTPFAAAAKLTGAGIGAGLAIVFAIERRGRALAAALGSLALAAATVPLFQATLGRYVFYTVDVQRSHPIEWRKILTLPATPHGFVALGAAILLLWGRRVAGSERTGRLGEATRVAIVTAASAAASLPAWLKYAGRDNNLTLLAVGAVCAGLLGLARRLEGSGPTLHPWLGPAATLLALGTVAPPVEPFAGAARTAILDERTRIARVLADDASAGRRTLVLLSTADWIAAGHRDVPGDRYQSAVELAFGGLPQGDLLAAHIADGRYDTIVAVGAYLRTEPTPVGRFERSLRAALERRYVIAGPPEASSIDAYPGAIVFRRSPRCSTRND